MPDEGPGIKLSGHVMEPSAMEDGYRACDPPGEGGRIKGNGGEMACSCTLQLLNTFPFYTSSWAQGILSLFGLVPPWPVVMDVCFPFKVYPYERYCAFVLPMEDSECLHIAIMIELHLLMYSHALNRLTLLLYGIYCSIDI